MLTADKLPSPARIKELFNYDPAAGVLTWAVCISNRAGVGAVAGANSDGRLIVGIGGVRLKAHRIIWCWMKGEWPDRQIDHRNLDGTDNRWENLRLATNSQNGANRGAQVNNSGGVKGVYPNGSGYMSRISKGGTDYYLGTFRSEELAAAAYDAKARELFGEFARAA